MSALYEAKKLKEKKMKENEEERKQGEQHSKRLSEEIEEKKKIIHDAMKEFDGINNIVFKEQDQLFTLYLHTNLLISGKVEIHSYTGPSFYSDEIETTQTIVWIIKDRHGDEIISTKEYLINKLARTLADYI